MVTDPAGIWMSGMVTGIMGTVLIFVGAWLTYEVLTGWKGERNEDDSRG